MTAAPGPLAIAVAINGAHRTKADHPGLPMAIPEIAREAARCAEGGAAMLHLHVRDALGRHSLDADLYRDAVAEVRREAGPDLIVQVSTEAVGRYSPAQQMALVRTLRPEAVSLALGEIVPDAAAEAEAAAFYRGIAEAGTGVQHILYGAAEIHRLKDLMSRGIVPDSPPHALFVLGRHVAGQQSDPFALLPFLDAWPRDWTWSVCAFGRAETACVAAAAALGGHVRVGFENSIVRPDGTTASSNLDAVSAIIAVATALGRPIASGSDARRIYGC